MTARDTFNKQKETAESAGLKRQAEFRSVIPGQPPLQNLIIPARSTVGAELLRSMGWKEGQGVGPKVAKYSSDKSKGKGNDLLMNQEDKKFILVFKILIQCSPMYFISNLRYIHTASCLFDLLFVVILLLLYLECSSL